MFAAGSMEPNESDEKLANVSIPQISFDEPIQPEDMANTIVFLVNEWAAMVVGPGIKMRAICCDSLSPAPNIKATAAYY